jgi:hypothetical protein
MTRNEAIAWLRTEAARSRDFAREPETAAATLALNTATEISVHYAETAAHLDAAADLLERPPRESQDASTVPAIREGVPSST